MTEDNTAMAMEEEELDFDLDATMDDVEDLIDYQNPVNGAHVVRVGDCSLQKVGKDDKQMVTITYQLVATLTQNNPDEPASAVGSLFTERFGNTGKSYLKKRMKSLLGDQIAGMTIRDQMQAVNDNFRSDLHIQLTTKVTQNDEGYDNLRINRATAVEAMELPEGYKVWEPKAD